MTVDTPMVRDDQPALQRGAAARRSRIAVMAGFALVLLGGCSRDVTVERVDRQVQLDSDGRVLETSASSTTFVDGDTPAASTTGGQAIASLTTEMATDGRAAIDCGEGATNVEVTGGAATGQLSDGSAVQISLVGTARLDDFDGNGRSELVAAYRCVGDAGPVALSLSLWLASEAEPRRSAVSTEPIEADWTVTVPKGAGDGRVAVSVLAPVGVVDESEALGLTAQRVPVGQEVVRQVLAEIEGGRLRLVSDGPPSAPAGVDSLPLSEFPDRLAFDALGLGPLRIGATEAQLSDALALVVSEVQHPPTPPCFGGVDRVLRVGPIYFGLIGAQLRAIWVTESDLVTTDRTIELSAAHGPARAGEVTASGDEPTPTDSVTVGDLIDAADPPAGLAVGGFGDGWVEFGPAAGGGAASIATESEATAPGPQPVTGFGIAERACLTADFVPAAE